MLEPQQGEHSQHHQHQRPDTTLQDKGKHGRNWCLLKWQAELETALLDGRADIAVHSMKDVPMEFPEGLALGAICEREDPRDAFVSNHYANVDALPEGAHVGTSSLRRRAQLLAKRPDLNVVEFRGNVQTRLQKLEDGVADATFLACCGLKRLGMDALITSPVPTEVMLPAVAQAAIGIEIRADDDRLRGLLAPLNDALLLESNPMAVKWVLGRLGWCGDTGPSPTPS